MPMSFIALVLAVGIYLGIGLVNLGLPGPHYDEVADAIPALELLRGEWPVSALKTASILGRPVPLMMLHYIGPTSICTSLLGFSLLGVSVEALRLTQLTIGVIALGLTWALARVWFGPIAAAMTALLLATAPVFVWWNRAGAFFASPVVPLAIGMLLALTAWWRSGRRAPLLVACALFGMGLTTKLLFAWLLAPLVLTAFIRLGIRGTRDALRRIGAVNGALCGLAFCLGFAPVISHNIPHLDSLRFIAQNLRRSQLYGHDNLAFLANLTSQSEQFFRLLSGDTLEFDFPAPLPLVGPAFVAAVSYTAARAVAAGRASKLDGRRATPRIFLLCSVLSIVPLSTFSVTAVGGRHLFILLPLAIMLLAACLADGLRGGWPVPRAAARLGVVGAVLALVGHHALANVAIHRDIARSGGRGLWSDAIYALAQLLGERYSSSKIVAMDWGFERSVALITRGEIRMREAYEYTSAPSPEFERLNMALLHEGDHVYLFHPPPLAAFDGHYELLERAALKLHQRLIRQAQVQARDGSAYALVYAAQPAPRSFQPPELAARRDATFGDDLMLLGGEVRYDPAKREVSIWLHWQSRGNRLADDTVLVHIVRQSDGEVVLVADTPPVYGSYPFDRWQRGEVVSDPRWVTLPDHLPADVYQVRIGVYDPRTGARRPIRDPRNDAAGDSLMLDTFEVR